MPCYFVGVYWGERPEAREVCAKRIAAFLGGLASEDPALSHWYRKAASRKAAMESVPLDLDGLASLLRTSSRDLDGGTMNELGFHFSAWNGRDESLSASVGVTCGAHDSSVKNSAVLTFTPTSQPSQHLLQRVLRAAVLAFAPNHGVVTTAEAVASCPQVPVWEAPASFRYGNASGFSSE